MTEIDYQIQPCCISASRYNKMFRCSLIRRKVEAHDTTSLGSSFWGNSFKNNARYCLSHSSCVIFPDNILSRSSALAAEMIEFAVILPVLASMTVSGALE